MQTYKDKQGDFKRDEAYQFAKEFGVVSSKSEFNSAIRNLSSIIRVKYFMDYICFESCYAFVRIKKGDEKDYLFGAGTYN